MKLTLIAVGRAKDGPERALFTHYAKRLRWPLEVKEVDGKRKRAGKALKNQEAGLLLDTVPAGALLVALDQAGRPCDSVAFARRLADWRDRSGGRVIFAIGGADGHGTALLNRADAMLSLGPMTWPHMLVRALLAEQLFRAQCILHAHPYHRE